jgi:hypothetical protein
MCKAHIILRSLVQPCRLENISLCFNTRLSVNKHFKFLIIFIEICVTVWLLCAHPLMKRIIFHTRITNIPENVSYVYHISVSADVHFSHFEKLKNTHFTSLHFGPRDLNYRFSAVWGSVIVRRSEIKTNTSFSWGRYLKYANLKYRYSYTN